MKVRSLWRYLVIATATRIVGCTYATPAVHVPEGIRALGPLHLEAADVEVVSSHSTITPDVSAAVQREVADILAIGKAPAGNDGVARVKLRVDLEGSDDFISDAGYEDGCGAMPLLVAAPTGTMIENAQVSVDVTIGGAGRTFQGHGVGDKNGSLYVGARRRAIAAALDQALADAARRAPAST